MTLVVSFDPEVLMLINLYNYGGLTCVKIRENLVSKLWETISLKSCCAAIARLI